MDKFLSEIHDALGINQQHISTNRLALHQQPQLDDLQVVDIDFEGKPFILISSAARSWSKMKQAAQADKIILMPFSGFRSYLHQKSLIERHLKNGRKIEHILTHIAIPGFSEHHSGRAIGIKSGIT
ncbi:MAG: D-alanyl-D-alanine carboxypeptidase family protein [Pseudobdellovibrionaceae bacterium]